MSQAPGQVAGQLRALCDPGSQINLITRESAIHVKLKIEPCKQLISGIGLSSPFFAHGLVDCFLSHRVELNRKTPIRFLVVPKITGCNPQSLFTQPPLKPITKDELADSTYNEPGEINALIGVATWSSILHDDIIRYESESVRFVAQNSMLGWVVSGCVKDINIYTSNCFHISNNDLNMQLERFWAIKENRHNDATPDEARAEEIFVSTHFRDKDGRYVVTIPFKQD